MTKFITIEGTEGVGKTSAITFIHEFLSQHHIDHITTREPGGTVFAEQIRQLLVTPTDEQVHYKTELLLFFASRNQHIETLIKPALAQQQWVISDRFTDASYAYQGAGRGLPMDDIAFLEQWVQQDLQPDVTILLDAPIDIAMQRVKKRGTLDRIEQEKAEFFNRVRACYLQRASQFPQRYVVIDASVNLTQVQTQLARVLKGLLRD